MTLNKILGIFISDELESDLLRKGSFVGSNYVRTQKIIIIIIIIINLERLPKQIWNCVHLEEEKKDLEIRGCRK